MSGLKAVVFDVDGTLFDSFELIYSAYAHLAILHGYPEPSRHTIQAELATSAPIRTIIANLFPGCDVEKVYNDNTIFMSSVDSVPRAFDGLHDILDDIKNRGLKLAVLTSGSVKVFRLLEHYEVTDHFLSIVHADRVTQHKPHPEGYLLAVEECGVNSGEAIMVGDTFADIQAGKRGGAMATVGVTHGNGSLESLQAEEADYIIDSLGELPGLLDKLMSSKKPKNEDRSA